MYHSRITPGISRNVRRRVTLALLITIVAMIFSGCGAKTKTDQPLPAFSLKDLKGRTVSFPQDFKGRAVYLMFFSTT